MSPGFEDVFRKQQKRMLNFIKDRIGNASDAEDLLQEVYYETIEQLNALRPIENLTAWLWRSIRNRVVDYYRRRKTQNTYESNSGAVEDDQDLIELIGDSRCLEAGNSYLRTLVLDSLYEAIEELPPEQREVVLIQGRRG